MNHAQALIRFGKYLTDTCPTCGKPPGQLCDTPGIWVHLDRMTGSDAWKKNDE